MKESGLLIVDKPVGPTSHQIVHVVRKGTGIRKVGHAGTLDPRASGVLVLCLGAATRLSEYLSACDKAYEAVVRFGVATTTYDSDGEVVSAGGPIPPLEAIEQALHSFRGRIEQAPPPYSAVKVQGKKAYQLARRGEPPALAARPIEIRKLAVTGYQPPDLSLEIECSAGTYIRTLAHDLGQVLASGGHLRALRRTSSGHFRLQEAVPLAELELTFRSLAAHEAGEPPAWWRYALPATEALPGMPRLPVDEATITLLRNGRGFLSSQICSGMAQALDSDGELVAILQAAPDGRSWHPHKVFIS
ncbi:MAG: tRNA pseudouridine(55) synthase TruB [Anaerolineales bacterium]|nr:tRNA pseudouridine(55) synthase TruB [Anaerolineales bacterium]